MKFETIILHVGPDKTGTTAIQSACDGGRGSLLRHGVLYPGGRWHPRLGAYFHDTPEGYGENLQVGAAGAAGAAASRAEDEAWMAGLVREWERTTARTVVMSYEGFFTLPEDVWRRIGGFLGGFARRVCILVYCRRPYGYALSAISQRVKSGVLPWGRYTGRLEGLRAAGAERDPDWRLGLPVLFYKHELGKMSRVFGRENILARKFGRDELPGGDVVRDFLSVIGVPESAALEIAASVERENPSLSLPAIQVGTRVLEILGGGVPPGFPYRQSIVPMLAAMSGPRAGLSELEAWVIDEASRKETLFLEKEFGVLFQGAEKPPERASGWTVGQVEECAREMLARAGWPG